MWSNLLSKRKNLKFFKIFHPDISVASAFLYMCQVLLFCVCSHLFENSIWNFMIVWNKVKWTKQSTKNVCKITQNGHITSAIHTTSNQNSANGCWRHHNHSRLRRRLWIRLSKYIGKNDKNVIFQWFKAFFLSMLGIYTR